jgi:hypothetical protein
MGSTKKSSTERRSRRRGKLQGERCSKERDAPRREVLPENQDWNQDKDQKGFKHEHHDFDHDQPLASVIQAEQERVDVEPSKILLM